MTKPMRVALLIESSRTYGRNLLAGIAAYARIYGPWLFYHEERSLGDSLPTALKAWRPDGVLARLEDRSLLTKLRRMGVPTVDLLREETGLDVPGVIVDGKAIVQLAIDHFQQLRLKNIAYCGFPGVEFSDSRCKYFVAAYAKLGCRVDVFEQRPSTRSKRLARIESDAMRHSEALADWLRNLPKPVGIMACNDMRAYQVLNVCHVQGIRVPDDVALLGVDNDALQCELCNPSLSTIDNNSTRAGYEAAALLDRMMHGQKQVPRITLIEPLGVIARQSTDALAVPNRELVEIVRYVRNHACEGLTPDILARVTSMSRSTLERWFLKHLGHSVNKEIGRVRLARIKELLITTNLPLAEIANLVGLPHVETMQRTFKAAVGQTPGQFRVRRQVASAASESLTFQML